MEGLGKSIDEMSDSEEKHRMQNYMKSFQRLMGGDSDVPAEKQTP